MRNRYLEKRYRGLHYEVGRLPDGLIHSEIFWSLPHEVRRLLFAVLSPGGFAHVCRLRAAVPESPDTPTLKPFLDTKSIFVHVPKCAGISVAFGLYGRKTGDHRTTRDYRLCFTRCEFESFFKFAFVRNPWDRLYSAYSYLKQGGRNAQDREWAAQHLSPYESFEDFVTQWVNEENVCLGLHFRPQYQFLCTRGTVLDVDFVGRFESLAADYDRIRQKLGIGGELPVLNKPDKAREDYRRQYNETTRAIVARVYREDIQLFGYDFGGVERGHSSSTSSSSAASYTPETCRRDYTKADRNATDV